MTTYQRPYPPGALTTQQAADVLGVSVDTVMRWFSEGRITELEAPSGRRPRFFSQSEIEAFAAIRGGRRLARQLRGLDLSGMPADSPVRERFWSKVDEDGPVPAHKPEIGPCREYTEHRTEAGYGQFCLRRGDYRVAHVVSYALEKGPVPAGMNVCHHCDNPPCVRPEHLFLGTQFENVMDMFAKDRQGTRHPGTERANARLTEEQVRAIRAVTPYFGRNARLAREFGVSQTTIRMIIAGRKWRHVA